jgi:hypothetical protein
MKSRKNTCINISTENPEPRHVSNKWNKNTFLSESIKSEKSDYLQNLNHFLKRGKALYSESEKGR